MAIFAGACQMQMTTERYVLAQKGSPNGIQEAQITRKKFKIPQH